MASQTRKAECRRIAEEMETFFNKGLLALKPGLKLRPNQDPINRPAFREYVDAVKEVLIAYEDYRRAIRQRVGEDKLLALRERFEKAVQGLNSLPTIVGHFSLYVVPELRKATKDELKAGKASKEDPFLPNPMKLALQHEIVAIQGASDELVEKFGDTFVAQEVGIQIERLKRALALCGEEFPLGVCRYKPCGKIFVKKRMKQLYCTPNHASAARVQRFRARKRSKGA